MTRARSLRVTGTVVFRLGHDERIGHRHDLTAWRCASALRTERGLR
ncbi:MAG: hypothetical protein GPOALKHO_000112 [Sodalis sp.]|nr:MAG: hypothetical protein GPOALKHO_000112 [Sodalis sp.]